MKSLAILGALMTCGAALVACSGVDSTAVSDVTCPPLATFQQVSPVLEQRCGTLDCHGQIGRPLRIYSQYGLRSEMSGQVPDASNYFPGDDALPTTPYEIQDNWASVCGLQPEIIAAVYASGGTNPNAHQLTLVRKPLLEEKHKGGQVFFDDSPGNECIQTWLTQTNPDLKSCQQELQHP